MSRTDAMTPEQMQRASDRFDEMYAYALSAFPFDVPERDPNPPWVYEPEESATDGDEPEATTAPPATSGVAPGRAHTGATSTTRTKGTP